jgi:N-acetylglucosamine kinase-like BadF-type ATPase
VDDLVIGVDAGGSNTRALLATFDGEVLGTAVAGAGNPVSVGSVEAARNILSATLGVLGDGQAAAVRAVAMGSAGGTKASEFGRLVFGGLADAGVRGSVELRPDLEAAFSSGTPLPDGYGLIAGTGATGGRIEDYRIVQCVGGAGWLLGDEGGGFWLGREAVRAAVVECDGSGPATKLTDQIVEVLGTDRERDVLIGAVYAKPPIWLASLAPMVTATAIAGDPVALSIVDNAASALAALLEPLHPVAGQHVVMIGGVVSAGSPVATRLTARLSAAGMTCTHVQSGAPGAAWLAILTQRPNAPYEIHTRLTTSP